MPKTKKASRKSTRRPHKKRGAIASLGMQFVKLQIAGNIPFWGTYLLFALLDKVFLVDIIVALFVASLLANSLFFYVDDKWVFADTRGKRKTTTEIIKFAVFMTFSAVFTFFITWQLHEQLAITPYVGQFISAGISTILTFIGLRFWVFAPPRHHGLLPPRTPTKI